MTKLESASNICAIIACAAALYLVIDIKFQHHARTSASQAVSPVVGKRVDLVGANWSNHSLNVVIAMTTTCSFCADSLPFYQRLSQAVIDGGPGISLLVVSPEPTEVMSSFLKTNKVKISNVLQASFPSIGVIGTPTVIALDSGGTVKRVFRGLLDNSRQDEVLSLVKAEAIAKER